MGYGTMPLDSSKVLLHKILDRDLAALYQVVETFLMVAMSTSCRRWSSSRCNTCLNDNAFCAGVFEVGDVENGGRRRMW